MLNVERSVSPDRLAGTRAPPVPSDLRFQIYDFGRDPQFQFSAFQRFSICPEISAFCFPFSDLVSGQWSVVSGPRSPYVLRWQSKATTPLFESEPRN